MNSEATQANVLNFMHRVARNLIIQKYQTDDVLLINMDYNAETNVTYLGEETSKKGINCIVV